jgi:ABC-type multidrug transport system permease subunit
MFGQTLLVALLLILVFGNVGEIADPLTKVNRTENLLFLLCVSAFWFGCNNAAKELVKERTIFLRERNYNLVTGSYLSSKVFVLAGIGILQVLVLYGCVRAWCDPPGELFPQALMMIALSLAGTGLGLAISALAGSEEVAIALIPVAVIPQIILSGAIAPLTGMPHDCARGLVTVYWGKRGLDDLLPDPLRGMAREMNLAVEGNYWWAVAVILSHAATFLMIAQLTLYFRGRARK